jgi:hypothetical protein
VDTPCPGPSRFLNWIYEDGRRTVLELPFDQILFPVRLAGVHSL